MATIVPDRGDDPKRKSKYDWEVHGRYDGKWERVHTDTSKADALKTYGFYTEGEPKTVFKIKPVRKKKGN